LTRTHRPGLASPTIRPATVNVVMARPWAGSNTPKKVSTAFGRRGSGWGFVLCLYLIVAGMVALVLARI
jgi:hypothetical protein